MRVHSLTRRMVIAVLALEMLCAFAFSVLALWHESRSRLHAFDLQLQGRSDSLLGAVQDAEDPADNVLIDPAELKLPVTDFYAVYQQGGRLLGGSEHVVAPLTERQGDGYRTAQFNGKAYRVFEREALRVIDREENGGVGLRRPVTIVYAAPTAHVWSEVLKAASFYGLASVVSAAITALLLVFLIRGFLTPIRELAQAASAVSVSSLKFAAPPNALRTRELQPLAEAMSAVVARLALALEAQHRFVGDATHELKTAVAVVRSSIQILGLKQRSPEQYQAGLERILSDNERTEELVSRMLTLARFEERSDLATALLPLLDMGAPVERTLDRLAPYALARGIRIESAICERTMARVPSEALQTLVSNLVINAVQHSRAGFAVAVRVCRQEGSTAVSLLEVQDKGDGIAASHLPFVFDRFYRQDTSRSRETGGAGLGLAICKSIVDAVGGTIDLQSVLGEGTTVRVTFRLP